MKILYKLPYWIHELIEEHKQDVKDFVAGELDADEFKGRRVPRGIYEQRNNGTYMQRIRVTGGVLLPEQAVCLAELNRKYSGSRLYMTTRQELQLHNLNIEDTPAIMESLLDVNLASIGGGGNTVRNVMACSSAGLCVNDEFDVTPFSAAVTEYLLSLPAAYTLPRKYKIAFSGCTNNCALATTTDVGFVATRREDGTPGFRVYAGGGLGGAPRVGDLLMDFLPVAETVIVAEAGRRLFDRIGDRTNRKRARLRHAVRRIGPDKFREALLDEIEKVRKDESVPRLDELAGAVQAESRTDATAATGTGGRVIDGIRVTGSRKPNHVAVPVHCPQGDVAPEVLEAAASAAARFSSRQVLLLDRKQNLVIPDVLVDDLAEMRKELRQVGAVSVKYPVLDSIIACTGAATCRLGICLSKNAAAEAACALDESEVPEDVLREIDIRISGCPNSCAQHPVADIGLFGGARRQDEKHIPGYQVVLGGAHHVNDTHFAELFGFVPTKAVPEFLVNLLKGYNDERQESDSFADYLDRKGMEALAKEHASSFELPSYEEAPDYYRDWACETDFVPGQESEGECGAAAPKATGAAEDKNAAVDLRGVPCPLNFAKARVAIDNAKVGETKHFILDDGDPVINVVRSFRNEGFGVDAEEQRPDGSWDVMVRK